MISRKSPIDAYSCNPERNYEAKKEASYRVTSKYPLCGYILGVLMHTTAWEQHWVENETLGWPKTSK